jgi:hypothetical protein
MTVEPFLHNICQPHTSEYRYIYKVADTIFNEPGSLDHQNGCKESSQKESVVCSICYRIDIQPKLKLQRYTKN